MPATFFDEVDPISVARRCAEDTVVGGKEKFSDVRYYNWLEAHLSMEALELFMPDDNDPGNTTASAQVKIDTTTTPDELQLILKSSVSNAAGEVLVLAPNIGPTTGYYMLGELVDKILALDHGWKVGLRGGHVPVEWFTESNVSGSGDWRDGIIDPSVESLALYAKSAILALTGVGGASAAVNAYGEFKEKSAARLRFYQFAHVQVAALRAQIQRGAGRAVKSRREGNVSRTFAGLEGALESAESAAQMGIYGAC